MKDLCNSNILLITKDALSKDYLPVYGNTLWKGKTPNLDELASKGTIFNRHYTAAPSTVMAFRSMVTGKFAHEQPYSNYSPHEVQGASTDMFETAERMGFRGHLIWDSTWVRMVLRYGNCYGNHTIIHNLDNIKQAVGCHQNHNGKLNNDDNKVTETINTIVNEIKKITNGSDKVFVWLHLPHVINGRISYGSDIDAFDNLIGDLRNFFSDDNIFISADHGNMNGYKGKWCYGFDVEIPAIEIPLISPRIDNFAEYNELTSNIDIKTLIFERKIIHREYVFSDSAYFAQPHRKLCIIKGNFAYIYNKNNRNEELYDLLNDRYERVNLLKTTYYDIDRKVKSPIRDYYYSPYWDKANDIVESFRTVRKRIWKNGAIIEEFKNQHTRKLKFFVKKILVILKK